MSVLMRRSSRCEGLSYVENEALHLSTLINGMCRSASVVRAEDEALIISALTNGALDVEVVGLEELRKLMCLCGRKGELIHIHSKFRICAYTCTCVCKVSGLNAQTLAVVVFVLVVLLVRTERGRNRSLFQQKTYPYT
jgi:hypothetical protein